MEIIENRNLLLDCFPKNTIIAEIGVFRGDFSKILFEKMQPEQLHLIDIFEGNMCSGDKDGQNMVWTDLSKEYDNLKEHFKDQENVFLHKGNSANVLNDFGDGHFDMIYIDGDHSYQGVKRDLETAFFKVKSGGLICGHDYGQMFPTVVQAVNEFCNDRGLSIKYVTKDGCPSYCIVKS